MDKVWVLTIYITDEIQRQIIIAFLSDEDDIIAIEETLSSLIIYHQEKEVLDNAWTMITANVPFDIPKHELYSIESRNWNAEWESSFQPINVDDFCLVRSSFHAPASDDRLEIIIDPEMAFGTGHHETTYLMLQQMRQLDFMHKRVLDYGSGTAILAILAEKMGSQDILAIDYDQQATDCAEDCLKLNRSKHIRLITGTITDVPHDSYDVILANINRNVLLAAAEDIFRLQAKGGQLLLSGILEQDFDIIHQTFIHAGYSFGSSTQKGEWLCLLWHKK